MAKWDPKLDTVRLSKAWRAYDGDPPPHPASNPQAAALHFWLGDVGDRPIPADAARS